MNGVVPIPIQISGTKFFEVNPFEETVKISDISCQITDIQGWPSSVVIAVQSSSYIHPIYFAHPTGSAEV